MHAELSVALNFIISHLYNKLPRRRVDVFREELQRGFECRFAGHWYPDEPSKGSGFRCVKLAADKVDPVVDAAAKASGLDIAEIKSYLPVGLTIWIDPREVSCRLTEYGQIQVIYRAAPSSGSSAGRSTSCIPDNDGDTTPDREIQRVTWAFDAFNGTGGNGGRVHDTSPSSSAWSVASPVGGAPPSRIPVSTTCFTAATFAQTKFGSTKMKTHGPQRPTRLSPTELPTIQTPFQTPAVAPWAGPKVSVHRLSPLQHQTSQYGSLLTPPADPRVANLQEWLVLQQQQQQQQQQRQYLAAMKQQAAATATTSQLGGLPTSSPHQFDIQHQLRQHLHLQQLHQPQQPLGVMTSPDGGMLPLTPSSDPDVTPGLDTQLTVSQDDVTSGTGVRMTSSNDCIDWGLDLAVPGFATGLHQLLLAN